MSSLEFTAYDLRDSGTFVPTPHAIHGLCGIYVLTFANGDKYVGQSVDVVGRIGEHRRRWDDIVGVQFAGTPRDELDALEVEMIVREGSTASLRNVLLTDRPGGLRDLDVTLASGAQIALPWRRSDRLTVRHQPRGPIDPRAIVRDTKEGERYERFVSMDDAYLTSRLLGQYVHQSIPAPRETAGERWSITAFPTTGASASAYRVFTLNVGNVEVAWVIRYIDEAGFVDEWRFNVWASLIAGNPSVETLVQGQHAELETNPGYADGEHMARIRTTAIGAAALLNLGAFADAAYRLNVHMMRKGSKSVYARFHNAAVGQLVLETANDIAVAERALQP